VSRWLDVELGHDRDLGRDEVEREPAETDGEEGDADRGDVRTLLGQLCPARDVVGRVCATEVESTECQQQQAATDQKTDKDGVHVYPLLYELCPSGRADCTRTRAVRSVRRG